MRFERATVTKPHEKSTSPWAVFPINPIYLVVLQISTDGNLNCRKEELFPDLGKQSEALELVFHGVFEFSEAQLDSHAVQGFIQFGKGVSCGYIHAGHRLCRDN